MRRRGSPLRPRTRAAGTGRLQARHERFEARVERALDGLPAEVQGLLEGVAIVIDDEPSPDQRREQGLARDETLYGLYEGTPLNAYGADWAPFPNKITLFRLPLEEDFPDPLELEAEVRRTVQHELAHHLGFDEGRLHELGLD
ncbi:MAG: metallopeptidase family protein [Chloroflexota bacterium]|nr:MAG: metallopeptidase family protein [Chloroflexota bacterium]